MPLIYVMESYENYDPDWAVGMDSDTGVPPFTFGLQDKISVGHRFDAVRRTIAYQIAQWDTNTQTNSTGFALWSGQNVIANGGTYDATAQFNQSTVQKNIDTGVVTFYDNYNSANLVPAGIGQTAKGTYKFITNPTAGQTIVLNGVTWTFVASGATGPQTNIKADTLSTITQLAWDLNNSANGSLTPAYYTAGNTTPIGRFALGITYKTGGTAGNAYTLAAGTYGGTISGATLTGGGLVSDGTWRRFVESQSEEEGADPLIVDPRTGNVWQHVDSFDGANPCTMYLFRLADNFSQIISPLQPPPGQANHMEPIGISDTWVYVRLEFSNETNDYTLMLTPRLLTAEETTLDSLLVYAEFPYDSLWNGYYFRSVFNHSTSMFTFGGDKATTRAFKLYRFDEPSSAPFGGPTVGGGFTDITPWGASTGPNTNVTAYTIDGILATPSTEGDQKYALYYLPVTNELAIVTELWAGDTTTGWTDPTLTRFDCTYVQLSGGTVTFDYHAAFVTGYMTSGWTTTLIAADAAWVVLGCREFDVYLNTNTYDFTSLGVDYTKRWFAFEVQPVVAGSWTYNVANSHTIFIQYQFISGAAPVIVRIIDEQGWDDAYPTYASDIGNTNVVYNTLGQDATEETGNAGLYDSVNQAFIWDAFNRFQINFLGPIPSRQGYVTLGEATRPFLRLFLPVIGLTGSTNIQVKGRLSQPIPVPPPPNPPTPIPPNPFNCLVPVISQYANSPIILTILEDFCEAVDPWPILNEFYNLLWNVNTAVGYGLDVWGRIVGVTRTLEIPAGRFLGFAQQLGSTDPFNVSPFFAGSLSGNNFSLSDDAFRLLIFMKALANITDGSTKSINTILRTLFAGAGNAYVTDNQDMSMTYTFDFVLDPVQSAIVNQSGVLPRSSGVSSSVSVL